MRIRSRMRRTRATTLFVVAAMAAANHAAAQPPPAVTIGDVAVSGSIRSRVEGWDWFDGAANGDYAFSGSLIRIGFRETRKRFSWQTELAAPILVALPDDAIAPGAQGQFGFGATYYAANANATGAAAVFLKQAAIRFTGLGGRPGQSVTLGRIDFVDGTEVVPKAAALAALKRDRIAHRLLGNFVFSHVGRSFDGAEYVFDAPGWNVTVLAARPTEGVFQANGWGELDVNVGYGAVTRQLQSSGNSAEWRAFVLGYADRRHGLLKTDNRPLAVRQADADDVAVTTVGGHFIDAKTTGAGTLDVLLWGAVQVGSWGTLSQRAGALAVEGGWQPSGLARVRPWIRGGYNAGSGDDDPNDAAHGTFFQVLPTPRVYARFPFFNLMNSRDAFAELILRPTATATIRTDVHALRLAAANDLWYSGGGAFQPATFGFTGRPSGGAAGLATLVDGSVDYVAGPHATIGGYVGFARGGPVVESTYPSGPDARFGYVELTLRF